MKDSQKQNKACLNHDDVNPDINKNFVCNKNELLTSNQISNADSQNSNILGNLTFGPEIILTHFKTFFDHIKSNDENTKNSEFEVFLRPAMLHTFADLTENGHRTSARELLIQHSSLIPKKNLNSLLASDEAKTNSFITMIRSKKYNISIYEASLQRLFDHLKGQENSYILQLINKYIDITILNKDGHHHAQSPQLTPAPQLTPSPQLKQSTIDSLVKLSTKLESCSRRILPSIHLTSFERLSQGLSCCTMSPDERSIASGCEDSSIIISTLQPHKSSLTNNNQVKEESMFKLNAHFKPVTSLNFFQDSKWLISGSYDKTVMLWDTMARKAVVKYVGHTYHVTGLTTFGDMFASCSYDQTIKLWTTDRIFPLRNFLGHEQSVNCIACHPNDKYLASGSSDATVRLWTIQDGKCVRFMVGHEGRVDALAFSGDGNFLASAGEDMTVKIWDLNSGSLFKNLVGHTDHVYSLAFNKRYNVLASGSMDGNIHLWDITHDRSTLNSSNSLEPIASFPTNSACIMHLMFGYSNVLHAITKNL